MNLFLVLIFNSCDKKDSKILIRGSYINLPDGMMYLCQNNDLKKIDSVKTIKGRFNFNYTIKNKNSEPVYLCIHHIDNHGIFRFISFPTSAKYREGKWFSSTFLSDSIISLNGSLTDFQPPGLKPDKKTIFTEASKLNAGYQTNAMFHINGDLFDNFNKTTYGKTVGYIKQYPNSFHLLYEINNNRNSFSANRVESLLKLFKGPIVDSDTFKKLKDYNDRRLYQKNIIPQLLDNKGRKTEILDPKFEKHLVVFWASWCGPCRQEIPALKKIYAKYKSNIDFVSISTDEKDFLWQKALENEQMPWKQLILKEKSKEYEPIEIYFQLSQSIPYIALMNNNGNVLKSHVGLMNEIELEKFLKD